MDSEVLHALHGKTVEQLVMTYVTTLNAGELAPQAERRGHGPDFRNQGHSG